MSQVAIPLSPTQASTLLNLLQMRSDADKAVVLYAGAIIAGTDYPAGAFTAVQPAVNGTPALLILSVPETADASR